MASNRLAEQRQKFDLRMVPTILEMRVGSPESIEGLSQEARQLKLAAARAKETIRSIGDAHFRIFDDPNLNDAQRLVRSAGYATAGIKRAREETGRLLDAGADLYRKLEEQAQRILTPTTSPGQAAVDAELRAWLRSQPTADVPGLVRKDMQLLAAAARAPAILSGLAADVHKTIQSDYVRSVDPDLAAQREDLAAAIEAGMKSLDAIEGSAKTLIDFETAAQYEGRRSDLVI